MARSSANVLVARFACCTLSATDPGIDGDLATGFCAGIWSRAFDDAGNFVAERERQRATGADIEFLAVAEQEEAILHMQIGMADAAALNSHQDLGALRTWRIHNGLA
jgi:hypothetical protein